MTLFCCKSFNNKLFTFKCKLFNFTLTINYTSVLTWRKWTSSIQPKVILLQSFFVLWSTGFFSSQGFPEWGVRLFVLEYTWVCSWDSWFPGKFWCLSISFSLCIRLCLYVTRRNICSLNGVHKLMDIRLIVKWKQLWVPSSNLMWKWFKCLIIEDMSFN